MARRVGEPVTVRVATNGMTGSGDIHEESAPTAFLWRGRLYVVREVLGHWRERQSWWTAAAARAVHGDGVQGESREQGGVGSERRGGGGRRDPDGRSEVALQEVRLAPGPRVQLDHEREVWRVEASAGRAFGSGVYDLSRSGTAPSTWHLLRVVD